ncbi:MAG: aminoacyl-tRNA hydrolase [Candidatus Portnoybacteria bacterium]|nr:aminoacyl-tRNA hydrolase [Candidatus Portnoybacteria bacterium]
MKLIVGLGNPGDKYKKTRHNLGFLVVDYLAAGEKWKESKKANCLYIRKQIGLEEVELIKPLTFMNNSGQTVNHIQKKHRIKSENILVIHDEIDLPLGEIRIQQGRGPAGHKGVQSVINQLGTKDFIRLRVGIRPTDQETIIDTERFVLEKFTPAEEEIVQAIIKRAVQMIRTAL